ncbi:SRPBCC family protein [Akkermansiaceae bacterium]|nr:SRPBCC family protein [Akkermansiaceae bacterium]
MTIIKLQTEINAPVERVFDLSRSIDAHLASTEATHEKVAEGRQSGLMELDEIITWEAKHFCINQRLTVKLTKLDYPHMFEDQMIKGAFSFMKHKHSFSESNHKTIMTDIFEFKAPLGIIGTLIEKLILKNYMKKFLKTRNLKLKQVAESEKWQNYIN